MADRKVSELNPALAGNLHDDALVHVVDLLEAAPADRNVQATIAQVKTGFGLVAPVAPTRPPFHDPDALGVWDNWVNRLWYWRTADGTVHIGGGVDSPSLVANWNAEWNFDGTFVLFVLPVGLRPPAGFLEPFFYPVTQNLSSGDREWATWVGADGEVYLSGAKGTIDAPDQIRIHAAFPAA